MLRLPPQSTRTATLLSYATLFRAPDDVQADAARRDLAFTALSCSPDGRLYDVFGGRADLAAGRVRFVGDARARIEEDYLRLLRFFRFQAHYGRVSPDPDTLAVARALAPRLAQLSGERIRAELLRLLRSEEHTSELQSLMRISYAVFCLKKKQKKASSQHS